MLAEDLLSRREFDQSLQILKEGLEVDPGNADLLELRDKVLETKKRQEQIESLLGTRVFLELFVKVQEEWRSSRGFVEELDWRRQMEDLATKQSTDGRACRRRRAGRQRAGRPRGGPRKRRRSGHSSARVPGATGR